MTNSVNLRKRISELDTKLDELIDASASRLRASPSDIELALEDLDTVQTGGHLDPQVFDPTGEMRRTYAERQLLDRKLTDLQDQIS